MSVLCEPSYYTHCVRGVCVCMQFLPIVDQVGRRWRPQSNGQRHLPHLPAAPQGVLVGSSQDRAGLQLYYPNAVCTREPSRRSRVRGPVFPRAELVIWSPIDRACLLSQSNTKVSTTLYCRHSQLDTLVPSSAHTGAILGQSCCSENVLAFILIRILLSSKSYDIDFPTSEI